MGIAPWAGLAQDGGMTKFSHALMALRTAFPGPNFTTDVEARYLSDWLMAAGPDDQPLAVLKPRSTEEVATALGICNAHSMPVVPQGGRTGLTGGATPVRDALLISLEHMNAIESIDPVSQVMVVEAGATLQSIQEAADTAGFMFPLDIGSRGSCQIGGNLSTNAGGNRVLRYGMARDMVLGVEAVLADGSVISAMNQMMKNNAGYDLKQMFIGSEGTLGIITRAVLKLVAKPNSHAIALTSHLDYPQLEHFLSLTRARLGGSLSAFEVMWPDFYAQGVNRLAGAAPLPPGAGPYALIEVSASDMGAEAQLAALLEAGMERGLMTDAVLAQSIQQSQAIWAIRDTSGELSSALKPIGNFDVSLATSGINSFVETCRERLETRWPGLNCYFFGHVVDGNVHLMAGGFAADQTAAVEEAVYDCVRDYAGSISAEHGIGLQKREHLHYSRTAAEVALMRQMKANFDPKGILNPGKVFA